MNNIRKFKNLIFIAVILVGVVTGLALARKSYFLSTLALTPSSLADVRYQMDDADGGLKKVTLSFKTGNEDKSEAMSTIAVRLMAKSQILNSSGKNVTEIVADEIINSSENWKTVVNQVYEEGEAEVVEFLIVNTDKEGFSTADYVDFASFYVDDKTGVSFSFDGDYSQIYSKRRPVTDIWQK